MSRPYGGAPYAGGGGYFTEVMVTGHLGSGAVGRQTARGHRAHRLQPAASIRPKSV